MRLVAILISSTGLLGVPSSSLLPLGVPSSSSLLLLLPCTAGEEGEGVGAPLFLPLPACSLAISSLAESVEKSWYDGVFPGDLFHSGICFKYLF